jgi:hypothetical protein
MPAAGLPRDSSSRSGSRRRSSASRPEGKDTAEMWPGARRPGRIGVSDGAPGQVVRAAGADHREEAAGIGLVGERFLGRTGLLRADQLAQHRRGPDQRSNALLRERFNRLVLRLHEQLRARVQVNEVADRVLDQRGLHQLGADHRGDDVHAGLGDRQHRPARDLHGGCPPLSGGRARLLRELPAGVRPIWNADARRRGEPFPPGAP